MSLTKKQAILEASAESILLYKILPLRINAAFLPKNMRVKNRKTDKIAGHKNVKNKLIKA